MLGGTGSVIMSPSDLAIRGCDGSRTVFKFDGLDFVDTAASLRSGGVFAEDGNLPSVRWETVRRGNLDE